MTALNVEELSELERVALGVLGIGLAPASLAGDPTLRVDYVIAVSLALLRGEPLERYLVAEGPTTGADFQRDLTAALDALEDKGILTGGGPPPDLVVSLDQPAVRPARPHTANFDQPPAVFDRYLAGRCLDALLGHAAIYRFIMDRYADSSEVWQRIYKEYL